MAKYNKNSAILEKIIAYCEEIEKTTTRFGKTLEAFQNDSIYRNACAMCILQIGELATNLSEEFRAEYDKVPWRSIRAMRNIFAHDYESMNTEETWAVIENRIAELKNYCDKILPEVRLHI